MKIDEKEKQFTEIYERELDSIFRYALLRTSSRDQALDIAQEAFTKLWKAFLSETQIKYPKAFLFTVTRNLIIDWYRKKKSISMEAISVNEEGDSYEFVDNNSYKNIQLSAEAREVIDTIRKLDPKHQEILYLRLVEDMLPQEIAELLQITPNATSLRIIRAMNELRKEMKITTTPKTEI